MIDLDMRIRNFNEYYACDGNTLCRTPNIAQMATYYNWIQERKDLTEKRSYSLLYSHYDAPGSVKLFTFDTIPSIIDFLKMSKVDNWYPNGLQVYENHTNLESELMMDSISNTSEDESKVPSVKEDKFKPLAEYIFKMNKMVGKKRS